MNLSKHALVVGGGVVGAGCAYYLRRSGWRVTIIDQGAFGRGCSHGNCGFVSPSHVLPLAGPGALWAAVKTMCRRNAPLSVKPRFDPALWAWLFRFARRCNERDMLQAGRAIQALLDSSRRLYDELFRAEPFDCEWQPRGLLFVFRSRAAFKHFGEMNELTRAHFNLAARPIGPDELLALEPALKPGLAGAWWYERDGHLRPDKLMSSWRRILESKGVRVIEHAGLVSLEGAAAKAVTAHTTQGPIAADAFVIAAGAWTPRLEATLGCTIPIQPGKGYSITMARPKCCPAYPLLFEEDRVAVTPMLSGYRLGSMMEFAGYDASLQRRRLDHLKKAAAIYLREPLAEPVQEEWFGWRPMTYDSVPIIDRSPRYENVVIAAGHSMLGVSMSPGTGRLVAEMLNGETPHLDAAAYRVQRFGG